MLIRFLYYIPNTILRSPIRYIYSYITLYSASYNSFSFLTYDDGDDEDEEKQNKKMKTKSEKEMS